jgi:hypothetical protein
MIMQISLRGSLLGSVKGTSNREMIRYPSVIPSPVLSITCVSSRKPQTEARRFLHQLETFTAMPGGNWLSPTLKAVPNPEIS